MVYFRSWAVEEKGVKVELLKEMYVAELWSPPTHLCDRAGV